MSRSLACLVLCCASSAHAAWTQIDPLANTTGWALVTIDPAFSDDTPQILTDNNSAPAYFPANQFWLDFTHTPGFNMLTPRNNIIVSATLNLFVEAQAGVAQLLVERLGDIVNGGAPKDNEQTFRVTSTAGARVFTQNVAVQIIPEPAGASIVLWGLATMARAANRRR